jgi:CRP-like cAMP-binding protein
VGATSHVFDQIPILAGLNPEALDLLCGLAQIREFDTGAVVFEEGSPGNELFVIARGSVEVVRNRGTGLERVLAHLKAGDFFGEMSVIECQPRSASIRVAEPSELHALKSSALYRLFEKWPDQYAILILNIARDMARRIRRLDEVFAARSS